MGNKTHTFRAIVAGPHGLTLARLRLQVERPVTRTVGQTLQRVLVHFVAVRSFPAFFAQARALHAHAVSAAVRVRAVHCFFSRTAPKTNNDRTRQSTSRSTGNDADNTVNRRSTIVF